MEQKIQKLKTDLTALMQDMQKESDTSKNIIKTNGIYAQAYKQMLQPDFNIVVCGEVKRGKSTFINALIGRELLPVNAHVATSQVFRVANSDKEEYFLQFDDGSKQIITHEQLKYYGSQRDADLNGENVFNGKRLLFIQANVPIEFLPKGVTIVDTPGLGALYKSHEEITHNYISKADAVVFVLDTDKPLVQQEKAFLANYVFPKTPYVMFIMTKVDAVDESAWVDLLRRNETLLKDAFQDKCYTTLKVFPLASTVLFKAATESSAEYKKYLLEDSLFPEAKEELLNVMNRTVGLYRNTIAYNSCLEYLKQVAPAIDEQIKMVSTQSQEEQQQLKTKKTAIVEEFNSKWGAQSTTRSEILKNVQKILSGVKNNANQLLSTSHPIYKEYYEKIEKSDENNITKLAKNLGELVINDLSDEWQKITQKAHAQVVKELDVMHNNIQSFRSNKSLAKKESSQISGVPLSEISNSDKFMAFRNQFMNASVASTVGGIVLVNILGVALGPIGIAIIGAGSIIYGILGGKHDAALKKLEKNKTELKRYLNEIYDQAKQQLLFVSVMDSKHASTVEAFVCELQEASEKAMHELYEQNKLQFDTEYKQLEEQSKLNNEQRKEELQKLNNQYRTWQGFAQKLSSCRNLITEIDKQLN